MYSSYGTFVNHNMGIYGSLDGEINFNPERMIADHLMGRVQIII